VEIGSFLGLILAQHTVECAEPFAAVRPLRQPFRPQQVTQLRMGADDAERHLAGRQLLAEIVQHTGASRGSWTAIGDASNPTWIDLDQAFGEFPGIKLMHDRAVRRGNATVDTVGWTISIVASLVEFVWAAASRES